MVKNCGKCIHFIPIDGMFGGCTGGMRERFDHETFRSVPACKTFEPIETEGCTCGNCQPPWWQEHTGQPPAGYNGHPMGSMMSMLMNMPPGMMVTMGEGLPPGMMPPVGPCGPQGKPTGTEAKTPWVNPLIKNPKPPKPAKVVSLEAWRLEKGK